MRLSSGYDIAARTWLLHGMSAYVHMPFHATTRSLDEAVTQGACICTCAPLAGWQFAKTPLSAVPPHEYVKYAYMRCQNSADGSEMVGIVF